MAAALAGAIITTFGVCLVLVVFQASPLAAALGLAAYGAVLLARWCRWRRSA